MRAGRHGPGAVTQTVIGSPGVYDPRRDAIALTGGLPGWERPAVLARAAGGLRARSWWWRTTSTPPRWPSARTATAGRSDSFAFVSVGTGIGMGLVIEGQLHRGAHGVAGEIGYMPMTGGHGGSTRTTPARRGTLEAAASAAAVVRAARRAGHARLRSRRAGSSRRPRRGDERAAAVVAEEAELVARAVCAIVTVVDPELVVLGGGIGQAPGFAAAVSELHRISPVEPEVRVSALGTDAVVDGCLAAATDLAWTRLAGNLPASAPALAPADGAGPFPSLDGDAPARTRARRNSTPAPAADGASSLQTDPAG